MAIYHLSVKTISRSSGRSATGAAAYRAGVKITDNRTGEIHDYTRKKGVEHAELVLPADAPEWASDREALWNEAEATEKRKNSTVAREIEIALPSELSPEERKRLALDFAREVVECHGCAADVAIHAPGKGGDQRNHHAHILLTTRRLGPDGLGEKTRELDDKKTGSELVAQWRERFATLQNERLQENGIAARVDHRSLEAQGIEREPTRHLGPAATGYERREKQPSDRRIQLEQEAAERLARAKELGELERASREQEQTIIDLSGDIKAAIAERDRRKNILERAQARHQGRSIEDRVQIRKRWMQRKQARRIAERNAITAAEQRPGIRHPQREQWQAYRERILTEAYNRDLAQALGRWVKVEQKPEGLRIHNRQMDLLDHGDRVTAGMGGTDREIAAMLDIARAKGWQRLDITGSSDFREKLGRAALDAGFTLADGDLQARIQERQRQEAATREAMLRKQAPILGDWMQEHPKRAALLKTAGRWLPGAPAGVEDWSGKAWEAAEAWRIGRHGTAEERQRLQTEGTPLQRDCVGDGREAGLCASAQKGICLRVGSEAPVPFRDGLVWSLKGEITRKQIKDFAQTIQDSKARYGVSHPLVVTFGSFVPEEKRVLVYEHLLRSGLEVQKPGNEQGRKSHETAQERLRTHKADGTEQQWVIDKRKREAKAEKDKADAEAKKAEQKRQREEQKKLEADRKKLREDAKALGWEVGRYGKSEERNRRAAGLLAEAKLLEVADLNKAYIEGLGEGRKEAALDACRKAGAAIQYAHGGREEQPACDEKTWEAVQKRARQAIAAAEQLGIPKEEAEGALYAGRDAVVREQQRKLARGMGGPGF
ncbi:MobQ family relaxase [Candidatus Igneacidithiobacillus taiwanensis]|uniref:MobQ family relaxase n=1 Tax=Candidatus Igneacidithiobacillus taiwanensis TaxID=1945924 RepID=UPI00289E6EEB|nr:MobQ family relaxase [Candidatus Igneacidithiobacillus taiwanensis]